MIEITSKNVEKLKIGEKLSMIMIKPIILEEYLMYCQVEVINKTSTTITVLMNDTKVIELELARYHFDFLFLKDMEAIE